MTMDVRADGRELEVRLRYRQGIAPARQSDARPGAYLGSGEGTVDGPGLSGGIRWDLNEIVGHEACQMFFGGIVQTEDGATITFDTVGFGQVRNPEADPSHWVVTAVARFESHDPRYAWLTAQPASWIGEFDTETYEHRYWIAVPKAGSRRPVDDGGVS